jgi:predicted RNase H-like HicB family nuclease
MNNYRVVMIESDEGFAVSCPALPGCHSQGNTREEALANIREAIQLWLEVAEEDSQREAETEGARVTRELVTV